MNWLLTDLFLLKGTINQPSPTTIPQLDRAEPVLVGEPDPGAEPKHGVEPKPVAEPKPEAEQKLCSYCRAPTKV